MVFGFDYQVEFALKTCIMKHLLQETRFSTANGGLLRQVLEHFLQYWYYWQNKLQLEEMDSKRWVLLRSKEILSANLKI